MLQSKKTILASVVTTLLTSNMAFSQSESDLLNKIRSQLPTLPSSIIIENREDLRSFVFENMDKLDESTITSLEKLIDSDSPLAEQIVASYSLDTKLKSFEKDLTPQEFAVFNNLRNGNRPTIGHGVVQPHLIPTINSTLSIKLEDFQSQLNENETREMISRLTRIGSVRQSSFGVGDSPIK